MSIRRVELMEARAKLEDLIADGEEILIVRRGVELARLIPTHPEAARHETPDVARLKSTGDEEKDGFDLLLDEVGDD